MFERSELTKQTNRDRQNAKFQCAKIKFPNTGNQMKEMRKRIQ